MEPRPEHIAPWGKQCRRIITIARLNSCYTYLVPAIYRDGALTNIVQKCVPKCYTTLCLISFRLFLFRSFGFYVREAIAITSLSVENPPKRSVGCCKSVSTFEDSVFVYYARTSKAAGNARIIPRREDPSVLCVPNSLLWDRKLCSFGIRMGTVQNGSVDACPRLYTGCQIDSLSATSPPARGRDEQTREYARKHLVAYAARRKRRRLNRWCTCAKCVGFGS